ncbi:pilin [Haliea sp. E17]|uniref:pilin n=1 Tax=Haliea sp. E17 TaxID=3401576 RepID=UPI003AAFDD55
MRRHNVVLAAITSRKGSDTQAGFTLVELMVIVAIVSILMVIALPAYLDYVTRSKIGEGMVFVAEAKTTVSEYYHSNYDMPTSNAQAGLPDAANYSRYDYISRLTLSTVPRPGTIVVTFKLPNTVVDGRKLQLVPDTSGDYVIWTCEPASDNPIQNQYIPPNCRS